MAEEKEKTVSVIIPTNQGNELARYYLPQLCAHIEECGSVTDYEVVVSDTSMGEEAETFQHPDLKKVRMVGARAGLTEIENLKICTLDPSSLHHVMPNNHLQ